MIEVEIDKETQITPYDDIDYAMIETKPSDKIAHLQKR